MNNSANDYGQLVERIGQQMASRAVGSAVAKNPLAYLIPCHRVIHGTGVFAHYRWGKGHKRLMIVYESLQQQLNKNIEKKLIIVPYILPI